ncbi:MAG: NUDIX domain-containing protein, partial [Micrococcales bacterium]
MLIIDKKKQILLLKTHFDPEVGLPARWITPGGGIDAGESIQDAAIRELHEETGLQLTAKRLGQLIWQTEGRWDWADGKNHHTFVD